MKLPHSSSNNRLIANQEQANSFRDEMFLASLEPYTQTSIEFLIQMWQSDEPFIHLTYGSFVALTPNSDRLEQDFENSMVISKSELRAQIAFDLCDFYLYDKKYDLAKQKAIECRDNLITLKREYAEKQIDDGEFLFCTFTEDELNGRLMACGIFENDNVNLLYQMNDAIMKKYQNIRPIFEMDNVKMEIPLVNRRIVELDMEGINANMLDQITRDDVAQITALNAIRSMIDTNDLFALHDFLGKNHNQNGFAALLEAAITFLRQSDSNENRQLIRHNFHNILLTIDDVCLKAADFDLIVKSDLLSQQEVIDIKRMKQLQRFETKPAIDDDWKLSDVKGKWKFLNCNFFSFFLQFSCFFLFMQ